MIMRETRGGNEVVTHTKEIKEDSVRLRYGRNHYQCISMSFYTTSYRMTRWVCKSIFNVLFDGDD